MKTRSHRIPSISKSIRKQLPSRSEEHTSELQSQSNLVCRLLLEKKKTIKVDSHLASALISGPHWPVSTLPRPPRPCDLSRRVTNVRQAAIKRPSAHRRVVSIMLS